MFYTIKKLSLAFMVFNLFMLQSLMADMMFYYSAAILPSIIQNKIDTPIGSIQSVAGSKTVVIESIYDDNSMNIYVGDVIVTDENTTASILLNNNTLIKLGIHTFLKITDYVFDDEIAVSPNPNIVKPVPFNLVVEGTIEIIDNYIETVQESSVKASALVAETLSLSDTKEKTAGSFETRRMTYEEYYIYKAIDANKGKVKVIYKNEEKNVFIVKIDRKIEGDDSSTFSKVKAWMIEESGATPSCPETTQSGSSGIRGTDFIYFSGTCSEDPAAYVKEGAIDIAKNDSDLPLPLEKGEATHDLVDKETADQESKNSLYKELYKSVPYIVNWHTDNCVITSHVNNTTKQAICYYDDNHINIKQTEQRSSNGTNYLIRFYDTEGTSLGELRQVPSNKTYLEVSTFKRQGTVHSGRSDTYSGNSYAISTYDENGILRSTSRIICQSMTSATDNNFKYNSYWDANGDSILNEDGYNTHNMVRYLNPSECPTYEQVNTLLNINFNFDWSQSYLYQMELTGSL